MGMMGGGAPGAAGAAAAGRAPGARTGRPNMGAANQHLRRKTQARGMRDRLERRKENVQGSVEGTDANA